VHDVERLELVLTRDEADARKDAQFRRRKRLRLVGQGPEERDQRADIGVIQVVEHRRRHHGDATPVRPDAMPEQPRKLRIRVAANRLGNVRRNQSRDPGFVEEHLPFGVRTMAALAAPGEIDVATTLERCRVGGDVDWRGGDVERLAQPVFADAEHDEKDGDDERAERNCDPLECTLHYETPI
jgi:hypothetical protein